MKKLFFLSLIVAALGTSSLGQQSKIVRLTGQVVCSVCWFEATDRKKTAYGNEADIQCAVDCAAQGIPQALAVEDEKGFTLYTMEIGALKIAGKDFLDLVPKHVEVEGEVRVEKDKNFIKVNTLRVLETPPAKPVPVSDDAVLALKDLSGIDQTLAAFRGRVVVLNFWATWCEPCKKEMPDLAAIQNDYAPLGVQVIGATADETGNSAKVLTFIRDHKVNFPVWLGATTGDMERFGVGTVLPATVIINREGKVVRRDIGIIKPAE
ncbi:MAG TPA: TlpA disulfide reductase family protein, partial [Pyrinomonadaceae bacterium]|nr:TlpA disulfide reductase family protein [Pyrinomonadaceae bacterium]